MNTSRANDDARQPSPILDTGSEPATAFGEMIVPEPRSDSLPCRDVLLRNLDLLCDHLRTERDSMRDALRACRQVLASLAAGDPVSPHAAGELGRRIDVLLASGL